MRTPGGYRRAAGACLNLAQEYDETSTKRELAEISISRSVRNQSLRWNDAAICQIEHNLTISVLNRQGLRSCEVMADDLRRLLPGPFLLCPTLPLFQIAPSNARQA